MSADEELVKKINEHGIKAAKLGWFADSDGREITREEAYKGGNCKKEMVLTLGNGEQIFFFDGEYGDVAGYHYLKDGKIKWSGDGY